MTSRMHVVVVGAGPVGMVTALALHRHDVKVTVLESENGPVTDQRAASLHPPTLTMLDALGVTRSIVPRGLISPIYKFHDRVTGDVVAEFDLSSLADELPFPFVLQYEQYKLTRDISERYRSISDFDVRFTHTVVDVRQDADHVDVTVEGCDGRQAIQCDYLVGADGGRSTVRRSQGIAFEGFTYPERFIKIATDFDFMRAKPSLAYRNYVSDPREWCNLFKVKGESEGGLWRAIFPTRDDEAAESALEPDAIERRLQRFFPKAGGYDVAYVNLYSVSQRVAETFRKGRVLLAGDAAHVNNPIGGMGMNGGIHDGINLADKLGRVAKGEADPGLLDLYTRQRRKVAVDYVQAQTIANKRVMEEADSVARARHFDELRRRAESKPEARAFMRRAALIESLEAAELA